MSEKKYPVTREDVIRAVTEEVSRLRNGGVYAIYSRLSRIDTKNPGYSLEVQPDRAEEFARSDGATEIKVYSDPGRSGKNSNRKEFQKMLNDIKAGRIDVVVIHRLDRIFRNLKSLLEFMVLIRKNKVRLVSVTEDIDTDTWWGRLVLVVLGSMAEAYLWQTSAHTVENLDRRRAKGLHLGRLPLGYCNGLCSTCTDENGKGYCPLYGGVDRPESKRGKLAVPHPVDRYVVPLISDLYIRGMSYSEVADYLNNNRMTLPDGSDVLFRTRGRRKRIDESAPKYHKFDRESVRAIVENVFYAGMVAEYRRPEFSLDDDLEHPENIASPKIIGNSRDILKMYEGQHEPLISFETWQSLQSLRQQRASTPSRSNSKTRIYPLSGVGRCWECYETLHQEYTLRGSTGKSNQYYRCAYAHDHGSKRKSKVNPRIEGVNPVPNLIDNDLAKRHKMLQSEKLEDQVDRLMSRLIIPRAWDDWIAAYYLSEDGMAEFERQSYGLRQELQRLQRLYAAEQIAFPEFERQVRVLQDRINAMSPISNPDAMKILGEYRSFVNVWRHLTNGEKRLILGKIFAGLYFDYEGRLIRAVAYEPFRELLDIPEDGMLIDA